MAPPSSPQWLPNLPGPGLGSIRAGLRGSTSASTATNPLPDGRGLCPGTAGMETPQPLPWHGRAPRTCAAELGATETASHRLLPNTLEQGPPPVRGQGPCPTAPSLRAGVSSPAPPTPQQPTRINPLSLERGGCGPLAQLPAGGRPPSPPRPRFPAAAAQGAVWDWRGGAVACTTPAPWAWGGPHHAGPPVASRLEPWVQWRGGCAVLVPVAAASPARGLGSAVTQHR